MLKEYKREKSKLLNQYDRLLYLDNILDEKITKKDIEEKREKLEDEHFFVSFTGQIKSGKSTLINAFLFGDEVIPTDDTPHTAKITIIKYGLTPKLEATLYSRGEWEELKSSSEFYDKFLKPDIEESISNGIYVDEMIYSSAKILNENSLTNLKEYVARGGKYTPFVNSVTIYYPNEILKEITIVDTPGTNDPNELRDRVAKEWVHKTDANIYITYANQAMDRIDIEFIDKFLLGVPREQKITVINKIDTINSRDGLNEYIDELFSNEELKRREILTNRENLVLVSGLGALIDKMLNSNIKLTQELDYYAKELDKSGFLNSTNHNLNGLERVIDNKLIENRGKNIILSHKSFIKSIFDRKIDSINREIEIEEERLKELSKDRDTLKSNLVKIDELEEFISKKEIDISTRFNLTINKYLEDFIEKTDIINRDTIIPKIKRELEEIKNSTTYDSEVVWIVKSGLEHTFSHLRDVVGKIQNRLVIFTKKEINRLQEELSKENLGKIDLTISNGIFNIYARELLYGMRENADRQFSEQYINSVVKSKTTTLQRLLDTKKGLESINSALMSLIQKYFEEARENMRSSLEKKIKDKILNNTINQITKELKANLNRKKESINSHLDTIESKERLISQIGENIDLLKDELNRVRKISIY